MAMLAELLTGANARSALARRDIAAVFGILRDAGVSQVHIARATGQRQSEVSEIIASRQVQSVPLLERIADGLGAPRGWMGLAYVDSLAPEPVAPDDMTEDDRRRNLLRHAATVRWGSPVFGAADRIHIHPAPTPMQSRIGFGDIQSLVSTTAGLEHLLGSLGGTPTSDALTAHARAGETLLRARMAKPVRRQLLDALADLHRIAGRAAGDAGLRDRSRQHYARGMSFAGAADSKVLIIMNLRGEGTTELQFGGANDALKLFQLGLSTAPTPIFRAVLENDSTWALARLGLTEEAHAALRRARDARQAANDEPSPQDFGRAMRHVEGCTQLTLGRFDLAVQALAAAVDGADHAVRCSTLNLSELATAQLSGGEVRVGLQTAARVVDKARTLRSVWVRDRLAPLQEAAAARRDSTCQDLARELATLRSAA